MLKAIAQVNGLMVVRIEGDDDALMLVHSDTMTARIYSTDEALSIWSGFLSGDNTEGLSEREQLGDERWTLQTLRRHGMDVSDDYQSWTTIVVEIKVAA
jgi:hypothetical protein